MTTARPCCDCGEVHENSGPRCSTCAPSARQTMKERGYDWRWRVLSERARKLQPFCSDCGSTEDLSADHLPIAWERRAAGLAIRLQDIDVVCGDCNTKRGSSRPGSERAS